MSEIVLSDAARATAGVLLLSVVAVESGGFYMLRIVQRQVAATGFQISFSRAGHAHAGVLVVFGLVCQLYADAIGLSQPWSSIARSGVPLAAILMPAGFSSHQLAQDERSRIGSSGSCMQAPCRWLSGL